MLDFLQRFYPQYSELARDSTTKKDTLRLARLKLIKVRSFKRTGTYRGKPFSMTIMEARAMAPKGGQLSSPALGLARNPYLSRDVNYDMGYAGKVVIPKGTRVDRATNLPTTDTGRERYWARGWRGMKEREKSWARNYGYLIESEDVVSKRPLRGNRRYKGDARRQREADEFYKKDMGPGGDLNQWATKQELAEWLNAGYPERYAIQDRVWNRVQKERIMRAKKAGRISNRTARAMLNAGLPLSRSELRGNPGLFIPEVGERFVESYGGPFVVTQVRNTRLSGDPIIRVKYENGDIDEDYASEIQSWFKHGRI